MSSSALADAFKEAFGFFISGSEAERIENILHDKGYAITPTGARMDVKVVISDGHSPYMKMIRARVQMTDDVCGAQFVIDEQMAANTDVLERYVPRQLSDEILSHYRDELEQRIALAIKPMVIGG